MTRRCACATLAVQQEEASWLCSRIRSLLTYLVGNAIFWTLWAAVSVSADTWYWWLVVPFAGWTIVLALHLWDAYRVAT